MSEPSSETPKWNEQFELRMAAAIGFLMDAHELPQGIGGTLDHLHMECNANLMNGGEHRLGYAGRLLGDLLVAQKYVETKNESWENHSVTDIEIMKSRGHKLLDEVIDDYKAMLKDAFAKMPREKRDESIAEFCAYAGERPRLMLNYIDGKRKEKPEEPQRGWFGNKPAPAPRQEKILALDNVELMKFRHKMSQLAEQGESRGLGTNPRAPAIEGMVSPVETGITSEPPRKAHTEGIKRVDPKDRKPDGPPDPTAFRQ